MNISIFTYFLVSETFHTSSGPKIFGTSFFEKIHQISRISQRVTPRKGNENPP
jgi:hypothetical protein